MSSSGVRAERNLVHKFWAAGFAVLRSPASGAGTHLPRPDLIVGSVEKKKFYVLEIKTVGKKVLYIDNEQIEGLVEFAHRLGFKPVLGVKFKRKRIGFRFLEVPEQLEEVNKSSNYKITYEHALSQGMTFGELIGEYKQKKIITD